MSGMTDERLEEIKAALEDDGAAMYAAVREGKRMAPTAHIRLERAWSHRQELIAEVERLREERQQLTRDIVLGLKHG